MKILTVTVTDYYSFFQGCLEYAYSIRINKLKPGAVPGCFFRELQSWYNIPQDKISQHKDLLAPEGQRAVTKTGDR